MGMKNILLRLAYDGSAYHGWQLQKNVPTVCDAVKSTLENICGHDVTLYGCGRTDAGVHATIYAANFLCASNIPIERLPYAVNTMLPPDIVVDYAEEVGEDFNVISNCIGKRYTYRILNTPFRDPFLCNRALWYKHNLDVDLMRKAAESIKGERDFKALCGAAGTTKTTVRDVREITIEQHGNLLDISVTANGFLYNMMRNIVGTLLYVNEGKIALNELPKLLDSRDRTLTGPTVPGCGLYMTGVWYENIDWSVDL